VQCLRWGGGAKYGVNGLKEQTTQTIGTEESVKESIFGTLKELAGIAREKKKIKEKPNIRERALITHGNSESRGKCGTPFQTSEEKLFVTTFTLIPLGYP